MRENGQRLRTFVPTAAILVIEELEVAVQRIRIVARPFCAKRIVEIENKTGVDWWVEKSTVGVLAVETHLQGKPSR